MKIAEMEKQIDRLGLKKLEVRLTKGSEVDIFICAIKDDDPENKNDDRHIGNIVVFTGDGRCWETTPLASWSKDDDFDVIQVGGINGLSEPESINGYELERIPQRDLDALLV